MTSQAKRVASLLGTAFFLGSCAPLQQAPLVYSSKVAVGIDISSNATENPGVSISLGVKTTDAAYVPVAVSKTIDAKAADGAASTPEIVPIVAKYGQGSADQDTKQLSDDKKRTLDDYFAARKTALDAADLVAGENKIIAEIQRKQAAASAALKTIDVLGAPLQPPVAPADPAVASTVQQDFAARIATRDQSIQETLNRQLTDLGESSIQPLPKVTQQSLTNVWGSLIALMSSLSADYDKHSRLLAADVTDAAGKTSAADDLRARAAKAANLLETSKTDAMSVYGRFDSDGTANAPSGSASAASGGLLVGKVFSTGLASQNLTEATKIASVADCISKSLSAAGVAGAASASDRGAIVASITGACSAGR
jgi:hypothetical protein